MEWCVQRMTEGFFTAGFKCFSNKQLTISFRQKKKKKQNEKKIAILFIFTQLSILNFHYFLNWEALKTYVRMTLLFFSSLSYLWASWMPSG